MAEYRNCSETFGNAPSDRGTSNRRRMEMIRKMLLRRDALRESGDSGFTLIELLVVILIIGILSAVVVIAPWRNK